MRLILTSIAMRIAPVFRIVTRHPVRLVVVSIGQAVAAFLEGIGIAAVIPLVATLQSGQNNMHSIPILGRLIDSLPFSMTTLDLVTLLVGVFLLRAILKWVIDAEVQRVACVLMHAARLRLLDAYLKSPWIKIRDISYGDLSTTAYEGAIYGFGALFNSFVPALATIIQIVVYAIIVMLIDWKILSQSAVFFMLIVVALFPFYRLHNKHIRKLLEALADLNRDFIDVAKTAKSLVAMRAHAQVKNVLADASQRALASDARAFAYQNVIHNAQEPVILVFIVGAVMFLHGEQRDLSVVLISLFALLRLLMLTGKLQQQLVSLNRFRIAADRYENFVSTLEVDLVPEGQGRYFDFDGSVSLRDVTVRQENGTPILRNITVDFDAGEFVFLMGPSGSGKTTLVDCILGLRDAEGSVLVSGQSIKDVSLDALRDQVGYVQQETLFFNGTILDNLTLFCRGAESDAVARALELADASKFVAGLREGLNTVLAEGGAPLSGGQRQRLAIARAILRQPRLLVLDEATASLDDASARNVLFGIAKLKGQTTVIVISHQDAAADFADKVVTMNAGALSKIRVTNPPAAAEMNL